MLWRLLSPMKRNLLTEMKWVPNFCAEVHPPVMYTERRTLIKIEACKYGVYFELGSWIVFHKYRCIGYIRLRLISCVAETDGYLRQKYTLCNTFMTTGSIELALWTNLSLMYFESIGTIAKTCYKLMDFH